MARPLASVAAWERLGTREGGRVDVAAAESAFEDVDPNVRCKT
jgi:hypothetical protein